MEITNEDSIRQIMNNLKKMDYIRPGDIPNIELYMDQVTTFMDEHLKSSKRFEDDKMLTKTMINNYTKNELLPSPIRKKYSKEHMLLLIFIYYFKSFLSISDIQSILTPLTKQFFDKKDQVNLEDIYKEVFNFELSQIDALTKDVIRKYSKASKTFPEVKGKEEKEFLTTFSFICMLSFDVYVKKMIIEKMIDQQLKKTPDENPQKSAKKEPKEE